MSLSNGRPYLAIPGPSAAPDAVLQAMHRPSPNIYAGPLVDMMPGLVRDLKSVARTEADVAIYIANGHGAWEAALANTLNRGDHVLMLATGRFGHGWAEMAERMGIHVTRIDFGRRSAVETQQLSEALASDKSHKFKAVLAIFVDTSTSVRNDIHAMRAALQAEAHPALLMVDCIASLGCDVFEMDAWGVDVMVTGCQKGLMTPPGIAFVYFNARAAEARAGVTYVSQYWDWVPRSQPDLFYQYFCGTAPTHHLYGLRAALDMIFEEGLEAVWQRHETLAQAIWAAGDAWAQTGPLHLNVEEPVQRSHAVTTFGMGGTLGAQLQHWVEGTAGVTLGIGLGMAEDGTTSDGYFRIGHMGHVNAHMVLGVLASIDAGLSALQIPHGAGALDAATQVVAQG